MFGLSQLYERLILLGVIAVMAVSGFFYIEHLGAQKCEHKDQTAALEQAQRDHKTDQETIDGLKNRIRVLEGATPAPPDSPPPAGASAPPELRVRVPTSPASSRRAPAGTQPGALPDRGCDQRVLGGAEGEATVDLGPVVQDLALAGLLNRADSEGLWERAVKQAQPAR